MLIQFPIALWSFSLVSNVNLQVEGDGLLHHMTGRLCDALIASVPGYADYQSINLCVVVLLSLNVCYA